MTKKPPIAKTPLILIYKEDRTLAAWMNEDVENHFELYGFLLTITTKLRKELEKEVKKEVK